MWTELYEPEESLRMDGKIQRKVDGCFMMRILSGHRL